MASLDENDKSVPTVPVTATADVVIVNVGGETFHTTWTTLTAGSEFFRAMHKNFADGKENTPVFVDRDPCLFRRLLSFLRMGPSFRHIAWEHFGDEMHQRLYHEAAFYGMDAVQRFLASDDVVGFARFCVARETAAGPHTLGQLRAKWVKTAMVERGQWAKERCTLDWFDTLAYGEEFEIFDEPSKSWIKASIASSYSPKTFVLCLATHCWESLNPDDYEKRPLLFPGGLFRR